MSVRRVRRTQTLGLITRSDGPSTPIFPGQSCHQRDAACGWSRRLRLAASNPAWWLADAVFLAFAFVQVALLGHDIAHLQFVRAGRLNSALGLVLGNLLVGVSRAWWVDNHNAQHARPNDIDNDPNVDILFLACTPEQALTRPRWVQWVIRHQVALLVPIFCLEFFSMHHQSIIYAARGRPGCARMEGWLLAAHFAVYGAVLVAALGPAGALAFALVHHFRTGLYMASTFARNHKGMPLANGSTRGFLREHVLTSRNIAHNWLIDLVYGGLNYQIEHHLFADIAAQQPEACRTNCACRTVAAVKGVYPT